MDVLKKLTLAIILLAFTGCATPDTQTDEPAEAQNSEASATPDSVGEETNADQIAVNPVPDPHENLTCAASDEFIKTHKFLLEFKDVPLNEKASRRIANQVSLHCQGAGDRFQKTLILMSRLGVGVKPSLEIALRMAAETDSVQQAFAEILKTSYLTEYLDLNFKTAINLAYKFSVYSSSNPEATKNDFTQFVSFCKNQQEMGLSLSVCTQYAVELAKISVFYKKGLFDDFKTIFEELKDSGKYGLTLKESLQVSYDVLSYGPLAPMNFKRGYSYASEQLSLTGKDALNFALDMAGRSLNQNHPLVHHERFAGYIRVPEKVPKVIQQDDAPAPLPGESEEPLNLRSPAQENEAPQ